MLRQLWQRWLVLARKIGTFQSRILLTLFYFVFVTPFGLLVRVLSDPLHSKAQPTASGWQERTTRDIDMAAARRQS